MSRLEKPPTLTDVARLAGVSVPAASRALNGGVRGRQSGSPAMQQRVRDAARALGYSVNPSAQAIKDGRARTVALVVADIADFGSATVLSGVMHAAEKREVSVAVRMTRDDPLRELDLLSQLAGERHRAVIIATGRTTDARREAAIEAQLRVLNDHGARVIVVGDSRLPFPSVTVDNTHASAMLARGLVDVGHRRFAVISAPQSEITARDRVAGFLEGLSSCGIEVDPANVIHREFSRDGGYSAVKKLEPRLGDLDAIAAMSDTMAVGAIARLRDVGVSVPDDIEVTGFDHVPMLGDVLPNFSTVEVPLEAFGEAALSLAFDEDTAPDAVVALRAAPIVRGEPLRSR